MTGLKMANYQNLKELAKYIEIPNMKRNISQTNENTIYQIVGDSKYVLQIL